MLCVECGKDKRIAAKGLCSACYCRGLYRGGMPRINADNRGKLCSGEDCTRPAVAKGMCLFHYEKTAHPLKTTWKLIRSRHEADQYPATWARFDAFLADVGERPSRRHQLRRVNPDKAYSRKNVEWREPVSKDTYTPEQRSAYSRAWNFKKFGITADDYARLLAAQGGACAVCREPPAKTALAVDHDHKTGKVRGLLCPSCNRGIGYFRDDPKTLLNAVAYLTGKPGQKTRE